VGERGGKDSKQILVHKVESAIRLGVPLLRVYLPHRQMAVVEAITEIFIALFDTFKLHLGPSFVQETMMYVFSPPLDDTCQSLGSSPTVSIAPC
jgi:hypothetical protein